MVWPMTYSGNTMLNTPIHFEALLYMYLNKKNQWMPPAFAKAESNLLNIEMSRRLNIHLRWEWKKNIISFRWTSNKNYRLPVRKFAFPFSFNNIPQDEYATLETTYHFRQIWKYDLRFRFNFTILLQNFTKNLFVK